jgi:hypothetical protein
MESVSIRIDSVKFVSAMALAWAGCLGLIAMFMRFLHDGGLP